MISETINKWEQIEKNPPQSYKEFFEKEKEFLLNQIKKRDIVLDVGCGDGRIIKLLSKLSKKIIGIDNDEEAIKRCNENLKSVDNVEIFLEDAEKTHFSNEYFDKILIMDTFCNFGSTKYKILREVRRILKNEGILIISVFNENALEERLKVYNQFDKDKFLVKENGTVIYNEEKIISEQFSEDKLKKVLDKANFEIEELVKGKIFYIIKAKIKN